MESYLKAKREDIWTIIVIKVEKDPSLQSYSQTCQVMAPIQKREGSEKACNWVTYQNTKINQTIPL